MYPVRMDDGFQPTPIALSGEDWPLYAQWSETKTPVCTNCQTPARFNHISERHRSDYCPQCGANNRAKISARPTCEFWPRIGRWVRASDKGFCCELCGSGCLCNDEFDFDPSPHCPSCGALLSNDIEKVNNMTLTHLRDLVTNITENVTDPASVIFDNENQRPINANTKLCQPKIPEYKVGEQSENQTDNSHLPSPAEIEAFFQEVIECANQMVQYHPYALQTFDTKDPRLGISVSFAMEETKSENPNEAPKYLHERTTASTVTYMAPIQMVVAYKDAPKPFDRLTLRIGWMSIEYNLGVTTPDDIGKKTPNFELFTSLTKPKYAFATLDMLVQETIAENKRFYQPLIQSVRTLQKLYNDWGGQIGGEARSQRELTAAANLIQLGIQVNEKSIAIPHLHITNGATMDKTLLEEDVAALRKIRKWANSHRW